MPWKLSLQTRNQAKPIQQNFLTFLVLFSAAPRGGSGGEQVGSGVQWCSFPLLQPCSSPFAGCHEWLHSVQGLAVAAAGRSLLPVPSWISPTGPGTPASGSVYTVGRFPSTPSSTCPQPVRDPWGHRAESRCWK